MGKKPNLLLVENDYVTAFIALSYFEKYFHCTHVQGASEALKTIDEKIFDVVLVDINLGDSGFDGTSVMKVIRDKPALTGIRICAFTSYDLSGAEEHFLKLGFDEYIRKATEYEAVAQQLFARTQDTSGNPTP